MYPIISYTIHITACLVIAATLLFQKRENKSFSYSYYKIIWTLGLILLINVPNDCVMLYFQVNSFDNSLLYPVFVPFMQILGLGVLFYVFQLLLCTTSSMLYYQRIAAWTFVLIGLAHPILFVIYDRPELSDAQSLWESYRLFLETDINTSYQVLLYVSGFIYLAICLTNLVLFLYYYYIWYHFQKQKQNLRIVLEVISMVLIPIVALIVVNIICLFVDFEYYTILPVWAAVFVALAIYLLNHKERIIELTKESVRMQMEYNGAKAIYNKSLKALTPEENLHRREHQIIRKVLSDWAESDDRPYANPSLTIQTLSQELGIPGPAISKYLHTTYGLSFYNFISYLNEREKKN